MQQNCKNNSKNIWKLYLIHPNFDLLNQNQKTMTTQIKIVGGKKGWHLKVNGLYINQGFDNKIKAIKCDNGIPYGSTEWVSINAIRDFWDRNRNFVVASLDKPYKSVWGQLEFIAL